MCFTSRMRSEAKGLTMMQHLDTTVEAVTGHLALRVNRRMLDSMHNYLNAPKDSRESVEIHIRQVL